MKKIFDAPEFEIVKFEVVDVLTTSGDDFETGENLTPVF